MALTQGSPLPDITQTTTRTDTAPDYYTTYLQNLSSAAKTGMGRTAEQGIAGYDPLQTLGYGQVPDAAGAYKPGLSSATQTAKTAAGGLDPTRIAALMDPYQKQVVDEMARLQEQNIQRSIMPSLKGAFVGRGDLGSSRYAGATGQTLADMQRNLMGQQYGALSQGYGNALKAAMEELNLQNQAAQTQAKLAEMEQSLGLTGAGALTKAGAEKQAYEQAKLDFPMKTATDAAALMRGYQIPTTQTEVFKGPKAGMYQTSPLSNILGVLSTLGGIKGGSTGDNLLSGLGSGIKNILRGFGDSGSISEGDMNASDAVDEDYWRNLFGTDEEQIDEDYWNSLLGGGNAKGGLIHLKK